MIWILPDSHYNHEKLTTAGLRPPNFTEAIIENCQFLIQPEDTVLHLGDVILGQNGTLPQIMARLPGRWILIRGNHDERATWFEARGFVLACEYVVRKHNGLTILFSHEPFSPLPDDVDYNIHGHLHLQTSPHPHRFEDFEEDPFYLAHRERYLLVEIESHLAPIRLDTLLKGKPRLAQHPKEIEHEPTFPSADLAPEQPGPGAPGGA